MRLALDQRALLFRKGVLRKVVTGGSYASFPGDVVELSGIHHPISLKACTVEAALLDARFRDAVQVYEIGDRQIGLLFEGGRFIAVLGRGRHAVWKSTLSWKMELVGLAEPAVGPSVDRTLLMRPELKDYVAGFSVEPYQKGLLFIDNAFSRILEPGTHFFWKGEKSVAVQMIDLRQQQMEIAGQEIMTREKIPLRLNFFCQYRIEDPLKVYLEIQDYEKQFYVLVQLALREYVGSLSLDEILERKAEIERFVHDKVAAKGRDLGLAILSSGIKDVILPGDIRDIVNQVLIAEKKAQANVITRREETASTRSLLNTAKLLEENATLYHLKELEYIERISEKISQLSISGGGMQFLEELKKIFVPKKD